MINMSNIRQWERRMEWQRQGRSWTELPKETKITESQISIRPIGNSISSLQYTQPFLIWAVHEFRERFGINE